MKSKTQKKDGLMCKKAVEKGLNSFKASLKTQRGTAEVVLEESEAADRSVSAVIESFPPRDVCRQKALNALRVQGSVGTQPPRKTFNC